ncbi:MAG: hypothetical protein ACRDJC_19085 [Thermomicrobiales bacterium]
MEGARFDRLIRLLTPSVARRQTLLGLLLGAFALGRGMGAAASPGCKTNGARCRRNTQCCSGTCKGKRKKGKRNCRPTPGARGCTIDDGCHSSIVTCAGPGTFCGVTLAGKPFCGNIGACTACDSNAECETLLNEPGARCVSCPEGCSAGDNFRACSAFA